MIFKHKKLAAFLFTATIAISLAVHADAAAKTYKKNKSAPRAGLTATTGRKYLQGLIASLREKRAENRSRAAFRLGAMGPGARVAVPALVTTLGDTDRKVRYNSANALGKIGPDAAEAVPALKIAAKSGDKRLSTFALAAIDKIRGKQAQRKQTPVKQVIRKQAPAKPVEPEVPTELTPQEKIKLRSAGIALKYSLVPAERTQALEFISGLGQRAESVIPDLVSALTEHDEEIRTGIADTLARMGDLAVPPLLEAIKDPSPAMRAGAADAMGRIQPPAKATFVPLIKAMGDDDDAVRQAAQASLTGIGRAVAPILVTALKSSQPDVRRGSAGVLGRMTPPLKGALPALKSLARNDPDELTRYEAQEAIDTISRALE